MRRKLTRNILVGLLLAVAAAGCGGGPVGVPVSPDRVGKPFPAVVEPPAKKKDGAGFPAVGQKPAP